LQTLFLYKDDDTVTFSTLFSNILTAWYALSSDSEFGMFNRNGENITTEIYIK